MPTTAITGAASGIGAALAKQLRETGHTVIGIDREGSDISADLATVGGEKTPYGKSWKRATASSTTSYYARELELLLRIVD